MTAFGSFVLFMVLVWFEKFYFGLAPTGALLRLIRLRVVFLVFLLERLIRVVFELKSHRRWAPLRGTLVQDSCHGIFAKHFRGCCRETRWESERILD